MRGVTYHYATITDDPDYQRAVLRYEISRDLMLLKAKKLQRLLDAKANFNPNQPRVSAGNPDGGQWTGASGSSAFGGGRSKINTRLAQTPSSALVDAVRRARQSREGEIISAQFYPGHPERYRVILEDEEVSGGHAISDHVGKNPQQLMGRMLLEPTRRINGSFPSIEAANKLVNSTLAQNQVLVDKVASGAIADDFIKATFSSPTGIEAFAPRAYATSYIRDTYGVGVWIVHDPSKPKGYVVMTAYPRND